MCFNQKGNISILICGFLKLVDKFTYLGSSISTTENDINVRLAKTWTFINRLSTIWKSDLSNKIKHNFVQVAAVSFLLWMHHMDADWAYREKAGQELLKNATSYIEQILEATPHKTPAVQPPTSHL